MALVWITHAEYVNDFKVQVTFNDGVSGVIDFKNQLVGKVFEPLKNVEFFKQFKLDSWTLTWPNDADFAPEFLYDLVLEQTVGIRKIG